MAGLRKLVPVRVGTIATAPDRQKMLAREVGEQSAYYEVIKPGEVKP